MLDYREALIVEKCRNELFPRLAKLTAKPEGSPASRISGNTGNTATEVPARAVRRSHAAKFTEGLLDEACILKELAVRVGQTVLDAGCGNGYMSKIFAEQVGRKGTVYAVDKDRCFIQALKEETGGTNLHAIEGDITRSGGLKAASVDIVYISTVIHVLSAAQLQSFIREVERLLKPGGFLAIVEIEKAETSFGPPLHLRYAPEELKSAVAMVPVNTVPVGGHFYMQLFRKEKM
ncbi:MAG: class I SAM-dependent methyltransferase [Desulfobacteraceae bacterium]|nr:MAG: class I SAM-dependent methyltransferase [Desulfobacteraceae bacterium]